MKKLNIEFSVFLFVLLIIASLTACSVTIEPQRLPTPEGLERSGNVVSWKDNPLYTDFIVSIDGEEYETSEPSVDISSALSKGKEFEVKVKAVGDGVYYEDSEWSKPLSVAPIVLNMKKIYGRDEYRITKCISAVGDIVLPQYYNGTPILEVGFNAFENCDDITSITVPEGYETIDSRAFKDCKNLKTVRLPSTVSTMKGGIFEHNEDTQIEIDERNEWYKVDGHCIIRKSDNTLIYGNKYSEIPSYVERIHQMAFYESEIESVTLPDGLKKIDSLAFWWCEGLKRIEIPASVTDLDARAFYGGINITEFVVDEGNPELKSDCGHIIRKSDDVLIMGCNGEIVIPDYVTGLGEWAFYCHFTQSSLIIPKSVTFIGVECFFVCPYLEYVYIPDTVKEVATFAFHTNTDDNRICYVSGVHSVTLSEGTEKIGVKACTVFTASEPDLYGNPGYEIGYDDGYPYVTTITYKRRSEFNWEPLYEFIITRWDDPHYDRLPYRLGYTFGGYSASPDGERITDFGQFEAAITRLDETYAAIKLYPIWIPNE